MKISKARRVMKSMQGLLNRLVGWIANLINIYLLPAIKRLVYLRVPVAIAFVTWAIYTLVDQTIEVYRAIASDQDVLKAIFSTFFVTVLAVLIWYSARLLQLSKQNGATQIQSQDPPKNQNLDWQSWLDDFLPRLLGITPLLALSQGIGIAFENSPNHLFLGVWLGINLVIAAVVFLIVTYRVEIFEKYLHLPILSKTLGQRNRDEGLFSTNFENAFTILAFLVLGLSTLPFVYAATGSFWSLGIIAIFIVQIGLNILLWVWGNYDKSQPQNPGSQTKPANPVIIVVTAIVTCAILLAATFYLPVTFISDVIGSVSVVAISLTIMVVIFSTIYNWGRNLYNIPAITLLVIVVLLSSAFNWNDNHQFRQFPKAQVPKAADAPLPGLEPSFNQWLANRPDRSFYEQAKKPYPVYLVSAQGGGIFAAYHAARSLSQLSSYSPQFPQHIFAISSVSGGSLGASTFSRLVQASTQPAASLTADKFPEYARKIFNQDLLSPLLTMGLFPDTLQRFLPLPAIYDWDRARGLEIALEHAWDQTKLTSSADNPFRQPFSQHWTPDSQAPALVINTTVVESGERLLFSPFQIFSASKAPLALDNKNVDLKLSTAAGLSARFPYVTPVGWFKDSNGKKVRLVDGGYFDNSGVPTALDLGRALQRLSGYSKKEFEIIYLALVDQPNPNPDSFPENEGLNEIASPLRAIFRAREARGRSAAELSTFTLNENLTDPFQLRFRTLYLQKTGQLKRNGQKVQEVRLPLGWLLSDASQDFIDQQTPKPEQCNAQQFNLEFKSRRPDPEVYNHNSCVAKSILQDLQGI